MHHLMLICGIWSGKSHSETRGRQAIGFSLWKVLYNARLLIGSQLRTLLRGQFPFCVFEIKGHCKDVCVKIVCATLLERRVSRGDHWLAKIPVPRWNSVYWSKPRSKRCTRYSGQDWIQFTILAWRFWFGAFHRILWIKLNMFFSWKKKKCKTVCIFVCVVFIYTDDLYINK